MDVVLFYRPEGSRGIRPACRGGDASAMHVRQILFLLRLEEERSVRSKFRVAQILSGDNSVGLPSQSAVDDVAAQRL